ncbi:MAG: hypothetical protein ABIO70_12535 [Pseudomonadota bacterium]
MSGRGVWLLALVSACTGDGRLVIGEDLLVVVPPGLEPTRDTEQAGDRLRAWESAADVLRARSRAGVPAADGERLVHEREALMDSLFEPVVSPYTSPAVGRQECPEEQRPKRTRRSDDTILVSAYETTANERFVYGGCTTETTFYASVYVLVYCRGSGGFHELKLFTPREAPSPGFADFIASLTCR